MTKIEAAINGIAVLAGEVRHLPVPATMPTLLPAEEADFIPPWDESKVTFDERIPLGPPTKDGSQPTGEQAVEPSAAVEEEPSATVSKPKMKPMFYMWVETNIPFKNGGIQLVAQKLDSVLDKALRRIREQYSITFLDCGDRRGVDCLVYSYAVRHGDYTMSFRPQWKAGVSASTAAARAANSAREFMGRMPNGACIYLTAGAPDKAMVDGYYGYWGDHQAKAKMYDIQAEHVIKQA